MTVGDACRAARPRPTREITFLLHWTRIRTTRPAVIRIAQGGSESHGGHWVANDDRGFSLFPPRILAVVCVDANLRSSRLLVPLFWLISLLCVTAIMFAIRVCEGHFVPRFPAVPCLPFQSLLPFQLLVFKSTKIESDLHPFMTIHLQQSTNISKHSFSRTKRQNRKPIETHLIFLPG